MPAAGIRNPPPATADNYEVSSLHSPLVSPSSAPAPTLNMSFIARQPILDVHQNVFAYELLFRAGWENYFSGDPDSSTRQMIDTTLTHGMEALTSGTLAFVNCTREALVGRLITCLPPFSTVLEVLETVDVDDEVIASCRYLKTLGYRIALDDFIPGTTSDRLLDLADYIKLDLRASTAAQLVEHQYALRHSPGALLAEKVETGAEFQAALFSGFKYFQGYFFARPTILANREIPSNRLVYLRLLSAIADPKTRCEDLERLVMTDASICFRILRLVNSARFGASGRIASIKHALLMIGEQEFHKLITVAAAACFQKSGRCSPELTLLCLHRARFCELLAPFAGQQGAEQYLIGLLSVVDAMLEVPMTKVVQALPLRVPAMRVLLGQTSAADAPLRLVHCYERGDWEACARIRETFPLSETELSTLYLESLQWATQHISESAQA